jgi:hypothetical protein
MTGLLLSGMVWRMPGICLMGARPAIPPHAHYTAQECSRLFGTNAYIYLCGGINLLQATLSGIIIYRYFLAMLFCCFLLCYFSSPICHNSSAKNNGFSKYILKILQHKIVKPLISIRRFNSPGPSFILYLKIIHVSFEFTVKLKTERNAEIFSSGNFHALIGSAEERPVHTYTD